MLGKKGTLCWDCANACCGCSWSKEYKPVRGWKARKTSIIVQWDDKKKHVPSYHVISCPQFRRG